MRPCGAGWNSTGTTSPLSRPRRRHTALSVLTRVPGMTDLRIGFIGLGNVGGQLAGNLLRHGVDLTVRDIDAERVAPLAAGGAHTAASARQLAAAVDVVITCLPSPAVCAAVMEGA